MTRPGRTLHPRIGASFALIPITFGFVVLIWWLAQSGGYASRLAAYVLMSITPVVVFYGGSLIIWCPVVHWTRRRVLQTIFTSVGLAAATVCVSLLALPLSEDWAVAATLTTSLIGGGVAIILLNWFWWTPPQEVRTTDPVPCPGCGYDLRGQRELRCPECGQEFTIGQLLAAVQNQDLWGDGRPIRPDKRRGPEVAAGSHAEAGG